MTSLVTDQVPDRTKLPVRSLGERMVTWEWLLGFFAIALFALAALTTDGFTSSYNLESSISRMAAKALLVLPLVFLIIAREIDISVASTAGLAGIVFGIWFQAGFSPWVSFAAALGTGLICGAVNGFLVTRLNLPSLVVTLGTLALYRGLCYVSVENGSPISPLPEGLVSFVNGSVPGTFIPYVIVPFLALAAIAGVVLHHTPFGRRIYAIGGSPETARYSGVRLERSIFILFVCSGVVAALAGVLQSGLTSSATPDGLLGFELDAVTIAFLGGVSFLGGRGRMSGVLWALIVVIVMRSMLQLSNVAAYEQAAAVGVVLIVSLLAANVVTKISEVRAGRRAVAATEATTPVSASPA